MRKYVAFFFFMGFFLADVRASDPLCLHAKNTVEETQCLSGELDKANKVLTEYLNAAKERIARESSGKPQLDAAQDAWLHYRSAQCGDVYTYWEAGTYRYRADLECEIELTRSRTHDIWFAYMRNFGTSPPLRPEP
jgi:uncharacterized protein YecT (DUF1311 family)